MNKRTIAQSSTEQEFEVIAYLKKYTSVFIYKNGTKAEYKKSLLNDGSTISFAPTHVIDDEGKKEIFSTSIKEGIEKKEIEDGFHKYFEEEGKKHVSLDEIDFINDQLDFLIRISKKLRNEYKYILSPLEKFLIEKRTKLESFYNPQNMDRPLSDETSNNSYKISNLLKLGMHIENPFFKNDIWTKKGKQCGTDFIRMLVENISKLTIEGGIQNYQLIATAHDVKVSDKSIGNVMKEGIKRERK